MDYKSIYDQLVYKAQLREEIQGYCEEHHIIPKCFGGSNDKTNLVKLTAREHFIAHKLLFLFCEGKQKIQMGYALHRILCPNNANQKSHRINSRKYEELKKIYEFLRGENHPSFGKKYDEAFRLKASESKIGNKNPRYGKEPWNYGKTKKNDSRLIVSDETRQKISLINSGRKHSEQTKKIISNLHAGKPKSEAHKRKLSDSLKGRKLSDETINKMSESRKGIPQKKLTCPHCQKTGGTTMYRWHFDQCKFKI